MKFPLQWIIMNTFFSQHEPPWKQSGSTFLLHMTHTVGFYEAVKSFREAAALASSQNWFCLTDLPFFCAEPGSAVSHTVQPGHGPVSCELTSSVRQWQIQKQCFLRLNRGLPFLQKTHCWLDQWVGRLEKLCVCGTKEGNESKGYSGGVGL